MFKYCKHGWGPDEPQTIVRMTATLILKKIGKKMGGGQLSGVAKDWRAIVWVAKDWRAIVWGGKKTAGQCTVLQNFKLRPMG